MDIAYNNNEGKKFYQEVNIVITDMEGNIRSNEQDILQKWSKYYEMHFELQDEMDNDSGEEWAMHVQTAEPYAETPNDVYKEMAVGKLKNGKATGHDQIQPELIKEGGREIKKLTLKIWEDEFILQDWKYGIIRPIHKKGAMMKFDN